MPYKDPEMKKQRMREWRKDSIANGYGKWLYARRSLRFQDADAFREALESIEATGDRTAVHIAREALRASRERWDALGPPAHRRSEPREKHDTLFEALEKLGLSN